MQIFFFQVFRLAFLSNYENFNDEISSFKQDRNGKNIWFHKYL